MPLALITAAAAGEVRNLSNTLAASGSLAVVTIPAEITLVACSSAGRGPSNSAPGTDTISLISWMAELGLAACHDFGTGRGRRLGIQDRLGFDLFSDTQAIENLLEMDSAPSADCWVGIDDRSGGQERALEGFDRGDVRLRRPGANCHANTDAGEGQCAAAGDLALLEEVPDVA